jgi:hypothetical protein
MGHKKKTLEFILLQEAVAVVLVSEINKTSGENFRTLTLKL